MMCRFRLVPATLAVSVAVAALGACSTPSTNDAAAIDQQRQRLSQLQQDPTTQQYATAELTQAEQSLASADAARRDGDDTALAHQIFMTDRALSTAQAQGQAEQARSPTSGK